jgi:hypothetical protein
VKIIAQLIPVPGGYAYQPPDVSGLHRQDGSPSQPGDVLSVQPDGTLQTRSVDAIGAWETLTIQGPFWTYATDGSRTVLILPPGL